MPGSFASLLPFRVRLMQLCSFTKEPRDHASQPALNRVWADCSVAQQRHNVATSAGVGPRRTWSRVSLGLSREFVSLLKNQCGEGWRMEEEEGYGLQELPNNSVT
jgi:hypothetical protein